MGVRFFSAISLTTKDRCWGGIPATVRSDGRHSYGSDPHTCRESCVGPGPADSGSPRSGRAACRGGERDRRREPPSGGDPRAAIPVGEERVRAAGGVRAAGPRPGGRPAGRRELTPRKGGGTLSPGRA
ncbi:hypothetical protein GCM10010517_19890 [Streptosporangium fragile]|uniref:Uncharacterized protein n=1 Tax=Streptosporangium fragile TaxID=46186 RepID=A0ABN3VTV7_9ACTN